MTWTEKKKLKIFDGRNFLYRLYIREFSWNVVQTAEWYST